MSSSWLTSKYDASLSGSGMPTATQRLALGLEAHDGALAFVDDPVEQRLGEGVDAEAAVDAERHRRAVRAGGDQRGDAAVGERAEQRLQHAGIGRDRVLEPAADGLGVVERLARQRVLTGGQQRVARHGDRW